MSLIHIQAALEKRLQSLAPAWPTAWENVAFKPVQGQSWQRLSHLINNPRDMDMARTARRDMGLLQIDVFTPLGGGRLPAMQRAEAIRSHFAPILRLTEGTTVVEINTAPRIAGGMADDAWWRVPVTVAWTSFQTN